MTNPSQEFAKLGRSVKKFRPFEFFVFASVIVILLTALLCGFIRSREIHDPQLKAMRGESE